MVLESAASRPEEGMGQRQNIIITIFKKIYINWRLTDIAMFFVCLTSGLVNHDNIAHTAIKNQKRIIIIIYFEIFKICHS